MSKQVKTTQKSTKDILQQVILDNLPDNPTGRLIVSPRVGKTRIVIELIKKHNYGSILWVTPFNFLAKEEIPGEFTKWKAKKYWNRVDVTTWASLHNKEGKYDFIVLDEEQYITENNVTNFFNHKIKANHLLSMSGTKTKDKDKLDLLDALGLKILYEVPINEAVELGVLSSYQIYVTYLNQEPLELKQFLALDRVIKGREEAGVKVSKELYIKRMVELGKSPLKFRVTKKLLSLLSGRKIVYCADIEQATQLSQNHYHSKTNEVALRKFLAGQINTLTMVKAGSVGFTYGKIDHLIVVQCDSDKNGSTTQKICRALMKSQEHKPTIWLLCLKNSQDEVWVNKVLTNFNKEKVAYRNEI